MTALWAFTGATEKRIAERMSTTLAHRGRLTPSSGTGTWSSSDVTLGVGLPRHDDRLGGLAVSPAARTCVAVAGRLPSHTTANTLLDAFQRGGVSALEATPGEWIIAVATPQRLSVIRDPAGARPAYWAHHGGRVYVAVEPKGIHQLPGFPREIDPAALAQYLTFSFVPGARTMLAHLSELEAGHRLDVELSTGAPTLRRWFVHEAIQRGDAPAPDHVWVARTRAAVQTAVADRLPPGQPVVAFLSGGLDSSVVSAVAARFRRDAGEAPPTTLSLHFGVDQPNELSYAREVAALAGTDHHEVEVRPRDLRPLLGRMVWHLDEPIGDPVTVGNFLLAEAAAASALWVLNGEGGDPVFGGPKNLPMLLSHWYALDRDLDHRTTQYLATWRRAGEDIGRLLHTDVRAAVNMDRDVAGVMRPHLTAARPPLFLDKLMVTNMRLKGANLILPKVDRMLGAHGMTPLSPLFDPALIQLSLEMPAQMKLRAGVEKYVLKQAFADDLPQSVVTRAKSGMRVPVHSWFQHDLKRTADEVLSTRAVKRAGIFDHHRIRDLRRYRTGRDGIRLWMLVTFELWRRHVCQPDEA